jgi:prepilin-type processing-associated H-X9-DG protein
MSISESLTRARHLSARTVSASNVKSFLIGCYAYSSNHNGQWPESLDVLVKEELTTSNLLQNSPYTGQPTPSGGFYYMYRFIADPKSVKNPSEEVVISEPAIHDGGAVFGFFDGHAEWVESSRAYELLSIMRSGQRP